jgi:hypothetical protein
MRYGAERQETSQSRLQRAIREDRNPFALLGLTPGFQRLLIFVRWTSYKCPYCGYVFRRDFWPSKVTLGSWERMCKQCGMPFDDGSREWPELPSASKLRLFLPPLAVGIWGGFVVAAVMSLYIGPKDEHSWGLVFFVSAFGALPAIVWSPVPLARAVWSTRRHKVRGEAGGR